MSARSFEEIGRRPPFLDEEDLLAAIVFEAASELRVEEARLRSKLFELGTQQVVLRRYVPLLDVGGEDAHDHV